MAGPKPIRQAFAVACEGIDGVAAVRDYEPGQSRLPSLPCVTMSFIGLEQEDDETGPAQTVRWSWDVYLYVDFSDAERAQTQMEAILPELVRIVRVNPGLDGTCNVARIGDALSTPELGPDDRWLRKRVRLTAEREEV